MPEKLLKDEVEADSQKSLKRFETVVLFFVLIVAVSLIGYCVWFLLTSQEEVRYTNNLVFKRNKNQVVGTNNTSEIASLKSFCLEKTADLRVSDAIYEINDDGVFGSCGTISTEGGINVEESRNWIIAKKINNNWTKIWEGNGKVDKSLINQYKIPVNIYPQQLIN